jgi:hypothetical protein
MICLCHGVGELFLYDLGMERMERVLELFEVALVLNGPQRLLVVPGVTVGRLSSGFAQPATADLQSRRDSSIHDGL